LADLADSIGSVDGGCVVGCEEEAMNPLENLNMAEAEMTQTWRDMKAQVAQVNALKEACARSHRCFPSRIGWGVAALLAIYVIFMHSFHFTGHVESDQLLAVTQRLDALEHSAPRAHQQPWWKR
jgi:hypothetical protein